MHELSVAQSIIDIVFDHVPVSQRSLVRTVRVRVGAASGVVPESLEFCFSAVIVEGPLASATIEIESVPFVVRCGTCGAETSAESGIPICADCGAAAEILSGTELQVKEIELVEPSTGAS
jgi:hydrogenase nickel incorporation protein HypA/HybF